MRIKPFCLIPLFSLVFFACGEKMVVKPYNEGLLPVINLLTDRKQNGIIFVWLWILL